jgi:AraC-like DNA-binding protein
MIEKTAFKLANYPALSHKIRSVTKQSTRLKQSNYLHTTGGILMSDSYPKIYLYKRIVQAKLFIDANFGEDIDLNNIADEAYFSKFHFIRLFKSIYGKTPHQYLVSVRIENTKLLLQRQFTVNGACVEVGFNSLSSFSGLFKRYTGLSPSAYQQQFKERQEQIKKAPLQFVPNCFAEQRGWRSLSETSEKKKSNFEEAD